MYFSRFHILRSLSPLALACIAAATFAQQPQIIQHSCSASPGTSTGGRIADECLVVSGQGQINHEPYQIQLEQFQPGDNLTHVYGIAWLIGDRGNSYSNLKPDETGYVEGYKPTSGYASAAEAHLPEQFIISSMHKETKELRLTMDLVDVSLVNLLNAFYSSKLNVERRAAGVFPGHGQQVMPRNRKPPRMNNSLLADGRRLSIHTVNATLDETLDLIYQQTGCSVFEEQGWMVIHECR